MYAEDRDQYLREVEMAYKANFPDRFTTLDSGKRAEHSDGVIRDTQEGKVKYPLMFPRGVPMKDQLIVRVAELYTRGGKKYGDRNWEDSESEDTLEHHKEALWRHFMQFFFDEDPVEDHAAAIVWNVNAVELTRRNLRSKEREYAKLKLVKPNALQLFEGGEEVQDTAEFGTPEGDAIYAKYDEAFHGAADSTRRLHTQLVYLDDSRTRHIAVDYEEDAKIGFIADRAAVVAGMLPGKKFTIALHMGQDSRVLPRTSDAMDYAGMWRWHLCEYGKDGN